ncbi:MAG: DUF1080 domain-containing protein [Puniceicoccaceae bacterium]
MNRLSCFLLLLVLASTVCRAAETPFEDLIGGNLDQWASKGKPVTKGWTIEPDGSLHLVPAKTGGISTKKKYFNFELVFEWKVAKGANSGVFYRFAKGKSPEYQLLDDYNHVRGQWAISRAGALYDLVGPPESVRSKPHGEWNTSRIKARGKRLQHWLNGVKVVDIVVGSDDWNTRYAKSKFAKEPEKASPQYGLDVGRIMLQDHGGEVWFRNMKIRELEKK